MRSIAYAAAVLAAAGIAYFVFNASGPEPAREAGEPAAAVTPAPEVEVKPASLTLNVPEMHCPFACYPRVKETLEQQDRVKAVELAPQEQEGVIDNPQVIVTYEAGFDSDQALAKLESEGFTGSSVVQP